MYFSEEKLRFPSYRDTSEALNLQFLSMIPYTTEIVVLLFQMTLIKLFIDQPSKFPKENGTLWVKRTTSRFSIILPETTSLYPEFAKSHKLITNRGISQGSLLGHIFFIIYINGFLSHLRPSSILYADDTTILSEGKTT